MANILAYGGKLVGGGEDAPVKITWNEWVLLTPEEQSSIHKAIITNVPGASGKISTDVFKKLWENPSPTSAFAAQTVTLASDDYDFLLLEYRYSSGTDGRKSVIASKEAPVIWMDIANNTYNGAIGITRMVTKSSDTSYAIGDGYIATGGSGQSTDNTIAIPTAIYGFKKNVEFDLTAVVADVSTDASKCVYDNTDSGLEATNAQDAIDESNSNLQWQVTYNADGIYACKNKYEAKIILSGVTISTASIGNIVELSTLSLPNPPALVVVKNNDNSNVIGIYQGYVTLYTSDLTAYATGKCYATISYPII